MIMAPSKKVSGSTAKKAPAKKAPAKKASAKKAPAKKASAKKTPVKKATAKKTPVKKATAKKAPVKKPTAKKAPVTKAPVTKAAGKQAPVKKTAVKKAAVKRPSSKKPASKASASRAAGTKSSASTPAAAAPASAKRPGRSSAAKKAPLRAPFIPRSGPPAPPADRGPVKLAKSPFKKSEVNKFRTLLLAKRDLLVGDLASLESQALTSSGEDSNANHIADVGSDAYERTLTLGLIESDELVVKEIHDALVRIEQDDYGVCQECGEPIPTARLEFIPWTLFCVGCQAINERM